MSLTVPAGVVPFLVLQPTSLPLSTCSCSAGAIGPWPSPSIAFPRGGPFDAQHGHPRLGDFSRRLASAGYPVAEQARQSAGTIRFVRWGVTPPYREPAKKESALKKAREVIAVGEII